MKLDIEETKLLHDQRPSRGAIYHVDFPKPTGAHYAIVISDDAVNQHSSTVVLALITSRHMDNVWPYQLKVPSGILPKPSKIVLQGFIYGSKRLAGRR